MLGVELAEGLDAKAIYADLLDHGLIVNAVTPTTLRLVPPITVTDSEIDEAVALIEASLARALADPGVNDPGVTDPGVTA